MAVTGGEPVSVSNLGAALGLTGGGFLRDRR